MTKRSNKVKKRRTMITLVLSQVMFTGKGQRAMPVWWSRSAAALGWPLDVGEVERFARWTAGKKTNLCPLPRLFVRSKDAMSFTICHCLGWSLFELTRIWRELQTNDCGWSVERLRCLSYLRPARSSGHRKANNFSHDRRCAHSSSRWRALFQSAVNFFAAKLSFSEFVGKVFHHLNTKAFESFFVYSNINSSWFR